MADRARQATIASEWPGREPIADRHEVGLEK